MVSKACVTAAYRGKLTDMVRASGMDLTLVVPPTWGSLPYESGRDEPFRTIVAPVRWTGRNHWHWYPGLSGLLRAEQPDLLHVDEEHYSLVTYLALRQAMRLRIPAVFFSWQNLYKRYPWPFSAMERYVLDHAAGALAGNEEAGDVLRQKGFAGPLAIVPQFGTDPELFQPRIFSQIRQQWGYGRDLTVVGYVGRLVPEKGLDILLEAMIPILRVGPHTRLVICGDGPLRPVIEAQIEAARLGDQVRWMPWVPSERMPDLMNALDIMVLPSRSTPRWKEQFGRVLTEAMASGVAVVGARSGEIPNVVGDAGVLFAENNPVALREELAALVDDAAARRHLAHRGRQRVLRLFTQKVVAAKTLDFYHQVLGS